MTEPSRNPQDRPDAAGLLQHERELRAYFAGGRLSPDEIDDSVQEVYARVLGAVGDHGTVLNPGAFLQRVAQNLLRDRHRRRRARGADQHVPLDDDMPILDARDPHRALEGRQELAIAREALGELEPICRQVFLLARFERYSHKEIAERLGIEPVQVGRHVARALSHVGRAVRSRK